MSLQINGTIERPQLVYAPRNPSANARWASKRPTVAALAPSREGLFDLPFEDFARVCDARVEDTQRLYARWVARRVTREFESHVRRFDYQRDEAGGLSITPQALFTDGRLMWDLESILKRYACPQAHFESAKRLVRARLLKLWGVQ